MNINLDTNINIVIIGFKQAYDRIKTKELYKAILELELVKK